MLNMYVCQTRVLLQLITMKVNRRLHFKMKQTELYRFIYSSLQSYVCIGNLALI